MSYIGKIPANAVLTTSDLADGIVTAAKIEDGTVVAAEIASNAVTTAKINADAVTGAKIADDAINSEHYTDGSIDTAHIADAQITTAKLSTAVFTGATDIGANIADADLFLLDDGAGGTIRKSAASRIKTYVGGVSLSGSTNNTVATVTGANALIGEANLKCDGSNLMVGPTATFNNGDGSTTVGASLEASGTVNCSRASSYPGQFNRNSDGYIIKLSKSGTEKGNISINSSAVAYNTSSDYRLKENVDYTFDATTRLKQLKPARFNFIADDTKTVDGFLAHEVTSVVPEAITGTHNEVKVWKDGEELPEGVSVGDNKLDADGNTIPDYQSIDQAKLVPLLVKTIQELEARITTLENA
tara:strand:- start:94 stop:1167 length:1074 start_codon:yes stop_codon:yes gene_type:complete